MSNQEEKRDDQRSLIKYARPVIVSTMGKRGKDKGEGKDIATTEIEDILNSILPPREYTKDKQQLHIESVSSTAATETDVIMLYNVAHPLTLGAEQKTGRPKSQGDWNLRDQRGTLCSVFRRAYSSDHHRMHP
jgi:hypothetical protein